MSKIVFIEPKNPNPHVFSQFKIPRLGTFMLATLMKQRGWDSEVILEEYCTLDFEKISQADLIGISTITATAPPAYAIADRLRARGCSVIMGGPHVTYLAEEALGHADFVIRGEGELPLSRFIDVWESDRNYSSIPSLSYRDENQTVCHNALEKSYIPLDTLPIPDFTLSKCGFSSVVGGYRTIPIQTSRGCPFNCSFCSVTGMFGRQYRYRSTESILEELRCYDSPKNVIFFCDDNFTHNRSRAKVLLKAMVREKYKFGWSTQVRVDVAGDEDLLDLMKQAGCQTVYIGFESVSSDILKRIKKGQTVEDMQRAVRAIHARGIHIHGMFVYGFDGDTSDNFKSTLSFAMKSRITSAQFLILTPFPGSETYCELAQHDRILFSDWSLYDAHHVVFKPQNISPYELQKAQISSHARFYSILRIAYNLLRGNWIAAVIGVYARRIQSTWKRTNRLYCKLLQ